MKKLATGAALLVIGAYALADQTLSLQWVPPSEEANPLITYRIEGKQSGPGSGAARTILETVEADADVTLTLADGPWWFWIAPCWTGSSCVTTWGVNLQADIIPTTGVSVLGSVSGSNGTISPSRRDVLKNTTTTFTITPDSGYAAEVGGTCGGSLNGTTYTTSTLTADCTAVVQFVTEVSGDDLASPTVSSAEINSDGDELEVTFDEAVTLNGAILTMESSVGVGITLSAPSSGSATSHTWSTSRTIAPNEVLYLGYVQPGDEIEDAAGNDLLSFTGLSVTNSSEAQAFSAIVLTPANGTRLRRGLASTTLTATTNVEAECVYGKTTLLDMDTNTAMETSDDLEHAATVSIYPGGLYQYCVLCRDLSTLTQLPAVCTRFWSQTW
jgi:hypothetical protein